ncbi:Rpn family recombination-promoting nuclease/putative transposase [Aquaspirillum soli]
MLPLLDPKNDYIFKRLFAQSPELLSDLINSIRYDQPPITITDILNPNISGEDLHAKEIVLDVLAKDGFGVQYNIEIQVRKQTYWGERSLYYSSRLISEQLESGQSYREMKHVICIHLLDFDLFPEHPEQASWRFELRDQHIPDVVLTKAQQIDILELDKADRLQLAPTALKNWVDLFEHWQEQHIMAQLTHTPVMTVLQSLEQMSQTKEERLRALARERAVWDYNTEIQVAEERGEQRGLEKGMQKGIQKGREDGMQTLLRTLIEARFSQPLPDWVLSRLRAATPEQLQQWGVSLTQAQRLEDIFEG